MALVRWEPWRDMAQLQNRINRMFSDTLSQSNEAGETVARFDWKPAVDTYEKDGDLVISADLPGVKKEDIAIDVQDNVLILKGERVSETEASEKNFYRRERATGRFYRAFTLPDAVDPAKIRAAFKDGVLKVEIPKPEEKKPQKVDIAVE